MISTILVNIGCILIIIGAFGIVRLPDVYSRLHASTLCMLGAIWIALGVSLQLKEVFPKIVIFILLLLLTCPVSSHFIARCAYRGNVKPKCILDELRDRTKNY